MKRLEHGVLSTPPPATVWPSRNQPDPSWGQTRHIWYLVSGVPVFKVTGEGVGTASQDPQTHGPRICRAPWFSPGPVSPPGTDRPPWDTGRCQVGTLPRRCPHWTRSRAQQWPRLEWPQGSAPSKWAHASPPCYQGRSLGLPLGQGWGCSTTARLPLCTPVRPSREGPLPAVQC